MRKSRFLLNLIAATAIGLSVFGCDSADSGAIGDTTDIIGANGNSSITATQALREYLLIAQRGFVVNPITLNLAPGQTAPGAAPGEVIAGGTGDSQVDPAQLYEIFGINNVPVANFNFTSPGGNGDAPNTPTINGDNSGTSGYHNIFVDPTNKFVIGMSRAKNQGTAFDASNDVNSALLQIYSLQIAESLEEVFPPNIIFGGVADPTPIRVFAPNQGEFISGAWSNDAKNFYAGIDQGIQGYSIDGNFGRIDFIGGVGFDAGSSGTNNPMKLLIPPSDAFVFAIDNANNRINRYARAADGTLSLLGQTPTVADPRGATIDRTGTYMYVSGRASSLLAGYRIEADGSLTPIEVSAGFGPIAFPVGAPIGDVDCSPVNNRLYLGTYAGLLQGYDIDLATGVLSPSGAAGELLAGSRNIANVEAEPSGQFIVTAQEHDYEALQLYVTAANGFAVPENPIFANLIAPNDTLATTYSPTPQADANGNTVFALPQPSGNAFSGDVHAWRIESNGSVRALSRVQANNPYGLDFMQLVAVPPVTDQPTGQPQP